MKRILILSLAAAMFTTTAVSCCENAGKDFVLVTDVVPDAILEIRYYSTYNFIGNRIPGYEEPVALLTRRAADSLKVVSDELLQQGYRLKIFDAYRPQSAVHQSSGNMHIPYSG